MAACSERGARLVKRYPILAPVPEGEREAVVRAALRHPLTLLIVVGGGLLLLPLYFDYAFALLGVATERSALMAIFKVGAATLAPLCLLAPLLSRFLIPRFIQREMEKRGYAAPPEDKNASEPKKTPTFKSKK